MPIPFVFGFQHLSQPVGAETWILAPIATGGPTGELSVEVVDYVDDGTETIFTVALTTGSTIFSEILRFEWGTQTDNFRKNGVSLGYNYQNTISLVSGSLNLVSAVSNLVRINATGNVKLPAGTYLINYTVQNSSFVSSDVFSAKVEFHDANGDTGDILWSFFLDQATRV